MNKNNSSQQQMNPLVLILDRTSLTIEDFEKVSKADSFKTMVDKVIYSEDASQCVALVEEYGYSKCYVITSFSGYQKLFSKFENLKNLRVALIHYTDETNDKKREKSFGELVQFTSTWAEFVETLSRNVAELENHDVIFSFLEKSEKRSTDDGIIILDPTFICTSIITDLISEISYSKEAIRETLRHLSNSQQKTSDDLQFIEEFQRATDSAIISQWYAEKSVLFTAINRGFRQLDIDVMFDMGVFIQRLNREIMTIWERQRTESQQKQITTYYGCSIVSKLFEKFSKSLNHTIVFNTFLLTSNNLKAVREYTRIITKNTREIGILFMIKADTTLNNTYFADIGSDAKSNGDSRILFATHSIFRIESIQTRPDCDNCYEINLTLMPQHRSYLETIHHYILKTGDSSRSVRHLDESIATECSGIIKSIEQKLLQQRRDNPHREAIIKLLARKENELHEKQTYSSNTYASTEARNTTSKVTNANSQSLRIHRNADAVLDATEKSTDDDNFHDEVNRSNQTRNIPEDSKSSHEYKDEGESFEKQGEYSKAVELYEKALKLDETVDRADLSNLAATCDKICQMYMIMRNDKSALHYLEKSLALKQKYLQENDPSLAELYNKLASIQLNLGEYKNAKYICEKSLNIVENLKTDNGILSFDVYNNMGMICTRLQDFTKALSNYLKALSSIKNILPESHPVFGQIYFNIGTTYHFLYDDVQALNFMTAAQTSYRISLPDSHPKSIEVSHFMSTIKNYLLNER